MCIIMFMSISHYEQTQYASLENAIGKLKLHVQCNVSIKKMLYDCTHNTCISDV